MYTPLDHPKSTPTQPLQGPPTRIIAGLLDRINQFGPQNPTDEEEAEMDRLEVINWGYGSYYK